MPNSLKISHQLIYTFKDFMRKQVFRFKNNIDKLPVVHWIYTYILQLTIDSWAPLHLEPTSASTCSLTSCHGAFKRKRLNAFSYSHPFGRQPNMLSLCTAQRARQLCRRDSSAPANHPRKFSVKYNLYSEVSIYIKYILPRCAWWPKLFCYGKRDQIIRHKSGFHVRAVISLAFSIPYTRLE